MNPHAMSLWERAKKALLVAKSMLAIDPDAAASRAYYSAFYAVSASFALEGRAFRRHSAVEAAVHRELVKAGTWPKELGEGYSRLINLRNTGDYGGDMHVPPEEAESSVQTAAAILHAVAERHPQTFTGLQG